MMRELLILFAFICIVGGHSALLHADAGQAYRQAIALAAQGRGAEAVAMLRGFSDAATGVWKERATTAAALIDMRLKRRNVPLEVGSFNDVLVEQYRRQHPAPKQADVRLVGAAATLIPGAGHAWLGRWHDAGIAALMVWPMIVLTLWAAKRRMGPVTVFFALLTLWLWSGSVFSAVSLAERGGFEAYAAWWQGLWQASGLPGRPW